ncbi:MAG: 50S ribosomal protein L22 [Candidatus Spechtbacteria bacterium]|nr:50S ribosomal protein L22 [Candidatus Spechtbacteria bacterium]
MATSSATLRYARISPRKVRLVVDLIRGLDIDRARTSLQFLNKRSAKPVLKLLESAIANAKSASGNAGALYVKKIFADQGPTLKRSRPRAKGTSSPINKKTSHITIVLDERTKPTP